MILLILPKVKNHLRNALARAANARCREDLTVKISWRESPTGFLWVLPPQPTQAETEHREAEKKNGTTLVVLRSGGIHHTVAKKKTKPKNSAVTWSHTLILKSFDPPLHQGSDRKRSAWAPTGDQSRDAGSLFANCSLISCDTCEENGAVGPLHIPAIRW